MYKRNLGDTIDAFGKPISIFYRTSTACASCGWDPVNEESTNPACSTCDGFGRVYSEEEIRVKGVVEKFAGNLRYVREGKTSVQIIPEGQARVTFRLSDLLINPLVSTSAVIFKGCQKVTFDGDNYIPKDYKRFGVKDLFLIEATFERIKEETT
jgi:hypothetical protein